MSRTGWSCWRGANRALGLVAVSLLGIAAAVAAQPTDRVLADERDGTNWASYGRTFSEQHYSPLAQINDRNVGRLGLAWSYDLADVNAVFTAPLAIDGSNVDSGAAT